MVSFFASLVLYNWKVHRGQLAISLWTSLYILDLVCCPVRCDPANEFILCVTLWLVGLCWSHPVRHFSFYQIRKLQDNNDGLLSYRLFVSMLLFSHGEQHPYQRCTCSLLFLFFLLITESYCSVSLILLFFVKLYLFSPPNKTGILMLSSPQYVSPQEDINYLEL